MSSRRLGLSRLGAMLATPITAVVTCSTDLQTMCCNNPGIGSVNVYMPTACWPMWAYV